MGFYTQWGGLAARLRVSIYYPDAYVFAVPYHDQYWYARWYDTGYLPTNYVMKQKAGRRFPYGEDVEPD
jgi:hypothetical protein